MKNCFGIASGIFFLLLFHILQIQKYFLFYQNTSFFENSSFNGKTGSSLPILGLPLAKALSSGSQGHRSSSSVKRDARADPHILVNSSLKSMVLIRE